MANNLLDFVKDIIPNIGEAATYEEKYPGQKGMPGENPDRTPTDLSGILGQDVHRQIFDRSYPENTPAVYPSDMHPNVIPLRSVVGDNKDPYRDDRMENRPSFAAVFGEEQKQKSDELIEAAAEDWASRFSREGNTDFYEQQKANRKKFLGRSNMIFFQTIALDLLAQHTGTKSYAEAFARSAMADLDAAQKTAEEDTMAAAMEALYFRPDGTYDPPKTQQEAFEALTRMGVDPVSASSITGNVVEQADKKYGWIDTKGQLRVTKQPPKDHEYTELTNSQAAEFIKGNKVSPVKMTDKQKNAQYYASVSAQRDAYPEGDPRRAYFDNILKFMGPTESKFTGANIVTYRNHVKDIFKMSFMQGGDVYDPDKFAREMGLEEGTKLTEFEALEFFTRKLARDHGLPVVYDEGMPKAQYANADEVRAAIADGTLTPSMGQQIVVGNTIYKNPTIK